jgi:RNA polymerase-binding transcription factor DksA
MPHPPAPAPLAEFEARLESEYRQLSALMQAARDTATHYEGPAEVGDEYVAGENREEEFQRLQQLYERRQMVIDAIERMHNGIYGSCINCSAEIGWRRLNGDPAVAMCRTCQEQVEGVVDTPSL